MDNTARGLQEEIARQLESDTYAWIPVGKGARFHRTTVRRFLAGSDEFYALSYGNPGGGYGYQIKRIGE